MITVPTFLFSRLCFLAPARRAVELECDSRPSFLFNSVSDPEEEEEFPEEIEDSNWKTIEIIQK